ncbi:hypothetical protein GQ457_02G030350 [Hibiscus cannabinus]
MRFTPPYGIRERILLNRCPCDSSGIFYSRTKPHIVNRKILSLGPYRNFVHLAVIIMDKGTRDQIEQMTASEWCPKDTQKIRVVGSLESFESDKVESTHANDERLEMQELKKQMTEMMDMMNTVEGQSGEFEGKGSVRERVPASKYNVENPFVIHVNQSKGGTFESSSSKTTTNLIEAREEKDMRGHVSLPLKYAELLPMLIDNKLVIPVRSVPKKPPFLKGYDCHARCEYHLGSSGHTTENCGYLRNKVREFIEMGVLSFEDGKSRFYIEPVTTQHIKLKKTQHVEQGSNFNIPFSTEHWKWKSRTNEIRARHLAQDLKETKDRYDILQDESNTFQTENATLKDQVKEFKASLCKCKIHVKASEEFAINKAVERTSKLQKAKQEIQKRDKDMKIALTQVREVALQVADLADAAMPLSQNLNSTLDNKGKLTRLLDEIKKLGSRAHRSRKRHKVPKSRFKEARSYKRRRLVDCSESPRKIPRTSADLEIFGIPISDIFLHLVEGRYITPRPMKAMPDPTAHSFDPRSTCDFHMGAPGHSTKKCRPLLDEIKKLTNEGVLTQDLIQQWKAKEVGHVGIIPKRTE